MNFLRSNKEAVPSTRSHLPFPFNISREVLALLMTLFSGEEPNAKHETARHDGPPAITEAVRQSFSPLTPALYVA